MKWLVDEKYEGMILRQFLADVLQLSGRLIKRAKTGKIMINGEEKTVRYILQAGDELRLQFSDKRSKTMQAERVPFGLVYEDDHLLVVEKEAGLPTMPSRNQPSKTLANGILYYYEQENMDATVHVVTRLDRDTSGLVLIAKHPYCHSLMARLQKKHELHRTYHAFVQGEVRPALATINAPIGRKPNSIVERMVTPDGQAAITHYKKLRQEADYAILSVRLETGRTHQIRVHFAHRGHPLLGDDLYGGQQDKIERQALHCAAISFVHPFTGELCHFTSDLPLDMKRLAKGLDTSNKII